jgi:hypothetical protein
MKLTPIANNQNTVSYTDGTEVFFSYSTPVAGYHPDLGYVRTKDWYSSTTTRHINKWLSNVEYTEVAQHVINNLAEGNGYIKEYTELEKELTTLEELSNSDWGKDHLEVVTL